MADARHEAVRDIAWRIRTWNTARIADYFKKDHTSIGYILGKLSAKRSTRGIEDEGPSSTDRVERN